MTAFAFDPDTGYVTAGGKQVRLTPAEALVFELMAKQPGKPVHRASFVRALWGINEPKDPDRAVWVTLHHVRTKLRTIGVEVKNNFGRGHYVENPQ